MNYNFYPIANYENSINLIKLSLLDMMSSLPVLPNAFFVNIYSLEGLGLYLQEKKDLFSQPTPYAILTFNRYPTITEKNFPTKNFLREYTDVFYGSEHKMHNILSPVLLETSKLYIKPIYQELTADITLSFITPSHALAYEYSRYFQMVFPLNKYIPIRQIPYHHNILIDDVVLELDEELKNELEKYMIAKTDFTSNREVYTLLSENWVMYKMDNIDIQATNVPFEGDEIYWRTDITFNVTFYDVAYYLLKAKSNIEGFVNFELTPYTTHTLDQTLNQNLDINIAIDPLTRNSILLLKIDDKIITNQLLTYTDTLSLNINDFPLNQIIKIPKDIYKFIKTPNNIVDKDYKLKLYKDFLTYYKLKTQNQIIPDNILNSYNIFKSLNEDIKVIYKSQDNTLKEDTNLSTFTLNDITEDDEFIVLNITLHNPSIIIH